MNHFYRVCRLPFLTIACAPLFVACGGGGDTGSGATSDSTQATTGTTGTGTISVATDATCNISGFAQAMLDAVNQARATGRNCGSAYYPGVPALDWNSPLAEAAAGHAIDMAKNDYFSHTSLDGRTFVQRIAAAGYAGSSLAENIAAGAASVDAVIGQWLASPAHCANLMSASYQHIGAACGSSATSTYGTYWVQDFGAQ